ncbi:MAG: BspA family leucine-rich repeat surface protein [Clostridia bacterium]|nr:BspA family leucine-rich repeat surface protein [Clostridia bacterium]
MLHINEFLVNKKIDKKIDQQYYKYYPKNKVELISNLNILINRGEYDFNCINTTNITDMSFLFYNPDIKNVSNICFDVSKWNVSNVTNMKSMFFYCRNFNCDISNWDVSNVKNMSRMFYNCQRFNCDLDKWNVSYICDKFNMFYECDSLKNKPTWYKQ